MSIIASGISFRHAGCPFLFENISLSVPDGAKVSLIGPNGTGKSTLLKILAGLLTPESGSVSVSSRPYYIPQQIPSGQLTVADLLGAAGKLQALKAICAGSTAQADFDALEDDWEIAERCRAALNEWGLRNITPDTSAKSLSGGEKTKAMLAGLSLNSPSVVLLDEPTNHLDQTSREKLYRMILETQATYIIVSHDISLLNLVQSTCALTASGIRLYGGGYDFYSEMHEVEEQALADQVRAEVTALRTARKQAQEVYERQERRSAQGKRNSSNAGQARILVNARGAQAQNSASRLHERHAAIIADSRQRLTELRGRQIQHGELKIDFNDTVLHKGKRLILAEGVNFAYPDSKPLWQQHLDIEVSSGDRLYITGDNGCGKTTLVKLLLGELAPSAGRIERAGFSSVYLDQEYRTLDTTASVIEMTRQHNAYNLADHEIKARLDRALFPQDTWDKSCHSLSGGERMRLWLCCMALSEQVPDLMVLDEPTNNLDIRSLSILSRTIHDYSGTLVIISHDSHFINEIGVTRRISLKPRHVFSAQ